jgi:uncharacterized protein YdiU (UPF0061 family)
MLLGFIHGVMNTDNTSVSGETIDYGPCAFMEAYEPNKVFSSIDHQGRYSYSNQPYAMHWNLARLAEALLPVLSQEEGSDELAVVSATEALAAFSSQFEIARSAGLRRKPGLFTEHEGDAALAEDLLQRMAVNGVDFTLAFRLLCNAAAGPEGDAKVRALFADATLREVARRAGVSHNAPCRHFRHKDDLLAAVATQGYHELTDAMTTAAEQESTPLDRLKQAGLAYVSFALRRP